jgi:hypothetical protein
LHGYWYLLKNLFDKHFYIWYIDKTKKYL